MFWFILSGLLLLLGIFAAIRSDWLNEGVLVSSISFFLFLLVFSLTLTISKGYLNVSEELKMSSIMIQNKKDAIKEMKLTYYQQPSSKINIDLVNKELSVSINKSIKELERFINCYNIEMASLKTAARFNFWYPCFVDTSRLEPLGY